MRGAAGSASWRHTASPPTARDSGLMRMSGVMPILLMSRPVWGMVNTSRQEVC